MFVYMLLLLGFGEYIYTNSATLHFTDFNSHVLIAIEIGLKVLGLASVRCSITAARDKLFMNKFFKEVCTFVSVRDIKTALNNGQLVRRELESKKLPGKPD